MFDNAHEAETSECNYLAYLKNYIRKQVVGIAIRLKYCKLPAAAKTVSLGEKRKIGRSAKGETALLVQ
jgi:hypothetical protein